MEFRLHSSLHQQPQNVQNLISICLLLQKTLKIYNLNLNIPMSKDKESICVTVRVRPLSTKQLQQDSRICLRVDEALNMISMSGPTNTQKEAKDFYFDSVCDTIGQNQVFERVGKRSTLYCMEGYNCTIFAYGQTGAGKTFTMMGVNPESRDYFQQRGLIPRTLEHLFECIQKEITESGVDYIIKCSFIEIYNEQIIDLLGTPNSSLNIRQDLKKGVYIEGVTEEIISQSQEAMDILRKGSKGRHVGSTFYNQTSSRSHSVFTMQIQSQQVSNGIKSTKSRHFHFIDLAGSERTKKSMGDRLKEGCSINKSLHVLSMVISSLAQVSEGKSRHVNYRDSKLTFLLKDSLGGNSKTHLIANISPSFISALQTKSTLMFARKVKLIKVNKVSINEDASGNLESLKSEIRRLRSQNLLLRNGNALPASISLSTSQPQPQQGPTTKMVTVLQQYVDQELEKQTQMQLEITKLQNKNNHLQKGIKHFSDNEKQLRMVIAIYEDKIKKLKKAEAMMFQRLEENGEAERVEEIRQYYMDERQILLEEIEKFKQLSSSSTLVKNLLRELKVLKENPQNLKEQEGLIYVLTKNNEFLQEIKNSISELQPQMQEGKASKVLIQENEELKTKMQELAEKVEKYGLELTQSKDKIQQTQNLLNEAISSQIFVEKKLQQQQKSHQQAMVASQELIDSLKLQLHKAEDTIKGHISKESLLEISVSQSELQLIQLKSQLTKIKERKQFEQLNFQEKLQALTTENLKLEEGLKKRSEEIQKLKADSFSVKTESQRANKEAEAVLADAALRIQELEQMVAKADNEKSDIRTKLELENNQLDEKLKQALEQKESLQSKTSTLTHQLRTHQQQSLRHNQQLTSYRQKTEQLIRSHQEQKHTWEQNHAELIKMINEKKEGNSETQAKLTEAQLEVISLNQRLAEMGIQYKNAVENYKGLQITSGAKFMEYEELLTEKESLMEQAKSQTSQLKRKLSILTESQHSFKRQHKILQQQIAYKEEQLTKANEQAERLKKKQKDARISINEIKNQSYALKKNYEVELEALREQIRTKEDQITSLVNDNKNIKEINQRTLIETQRKMQTQFEIFKQNEGSIKKAMETHLMNKQKRITELKTANDTLQQQARERSAHVQALQRDLQATVDKVNEAMATLQLLRKQKFDLQLAYAKSQESMNTLQSDHLRAVEQMQNNFNEELDSKNAQIEKLRRSSVENQTKLENLSKIEQQNSVLKSELINRQAICQQLQNVRTFLLRDLESTRNNGQQTNSYIAELQGQLNERNTYIQQLNDNIRIMEANFDSQVCEKQGVIKKLEAGLKEMQMEVQNLQKNQSRIVKERTQVVGNLEMVLRDKENTINQLVMKNKKIEAGLKYVQEQIVPNLETRNKILQNAVEQTTSYNKNVSEENQRLLSALRDLEEAQENFQGEIRDRRQLFQREINGQRQRNNGLSHQIRGLMEQNSTLKRKISQLQISGERREQEFANMEAHFANVQKRAENQQNMLNQRLAKIHQEASREAQRLNELYEASKQKVESLRAQNERFIQSENHTRKAFEMRIQQLENQYQSKCQLLDSLQNDLNGQRQKNEELQRYIDEQGYKITGLQQQRDRLAEQLQEMKVDSEKRLRQSQKRCQLGAAQMNSLREQIKLIQDEASVWKQRMQNLQNEIRLSNDRAQKFRSQYMKEKQTNKEFKQLLDNAHCQVESFKNEVIDKDKLYHQLLEKVSKNDIERKGLMTQDKKFNDLLEKSRIQVSQTRKKYQDQLKINNLLKQELEKKDIDVSVVKERSEEYCRKQQQLIDSIRADYSKVETELKVTQKALKKVTLKNEELEEQAQRFNKDYVELERHNEQLKKDSLKTAMDERQMGYLNKLKEENTQLKRQLEKVSEEVITVNQEKLKLKSELRQGKQVDVSSLELSKKISQVKYLQKIIDDSVNVLGIRDYKKSVGDSLKSGIMQLQRQLTKSRAQLSQLTDQLSLKNQRLQILQNQKLKISSKEQEDTLTKMRNKISKTNSTFESIRQSKEQDKLILQMKDTNKWGLGRP